MHKPSYTQKEPSQSAMHSKRQTRFYAKEKRSKNKPGDLEHFNGRLLGVER
jgi:hypothetical protein